MKASRRYNRDRSTAGNGNQKTHDRSMEPVFNQNMGYKQHDVHEPYVDEVIIKVTVRNDHPVLESTIFVKHNIER